MIREVYIDSQQVDIDDKNVPGYIFESPIFRDITKIISNRTTTYTLPKTERNLAIFGLSNNPEVRTMFPYSEHTFEERRNDIPFIKGICTLIKISDKGLELSVIWGNTMNIRGLKDKKLRELSQRGQYITWDSSSKFLEARDVEDPDDIEDVGFIVVDFGKGVAPAKSNENTPIKYIHPSVTISRILKMIESSEKISIKYPKRFDKVFTKRWVPLVDKNSDSTLESKYQVAGKNNGFRENGTDVKLIKIRRPTNNIIDDTNGYINLSKEGNFKITISGTVKDNQPVMEGDKYKSAVVGLAVYKWDYFTNGYHQLVNIITKPKEASADGVYDLAFEYNYEGTPGKSYHIYPIVAYNQVSGHDKLPFNEPEISLLCDILPEKDNVIYGEDFPIVANLPDMSVIDFLKSLMNMYGLFAYYDFRKDDNSIEFISIEDIYRLSTEEGEDIDGGYKDLAYDWTHKLVNTTRGRMNMTFVYGDYAQENTFAYKSESDVSTNADGVLKIKNGTIPKEKKLVELPFAAADNATDVNGNTYALLNVYEGTEHKSTSYRILKEEIYIANDGGSKKLKSGYFAKEQKYAGDGGLLAKYYKEYQHILEYPVVAECYIYLDDFELATYKEQYPVFIDGVYYMPIKVTVKEGGLATCTLIKMPPLNDD